MPVNKVMRLQEHLIAHGFMDRADLVEVADGDPLPPKLVDALKPIALAVPGARERLRIHPTDDLGPWIDLLSRRFCGVPDRPHGISIQTFGSPGGRWSKSSLRFSINTAGCNFQNVAGAPPTNAAAVISQAFALWQTVAQPFLTLTQVAPNSGEDIRVFFIGRSTDPSFGSSGSVLGDGAYPPGGNIRLDSGETWSATGAAPNSVSLLSVALHEIGHALGLSHSNRPGGLMYPYDASAAAVDAESADAFRSLYGWTPQKNIPSRGTSDRPSLAITSSTNFTSRFDTVHMAWKGIGDDHAIYESEFDGDTWTPQRNIPGIGSTHSPSLLGLGGVPNSGLFMAWRGIPRDQGLYWSRNMGGGWEPQKKIPGVGSSTRPALGTRGGQIVMAWKGIEGDSGIYWSTFDGTSWSPQQKVRGVGTTDSPALLWAAGGLHMFWRGIEGDSTAYHSVLPDGANGIWTPQRRIEYFNYQASGGVALAIGTTGGLAVAHRGNRIILAWKGVRGDSGIYFSVLENNEFSGQIRVPNVGTSVGPSIVEANGRNVMAWKGIDGDSGIYFAQL